MAHVSNFYPESHLFFISKVYSGNFDLSKRGSFNSSLLNYY